MARSPKAHSHRDPHFSSPDCESLEVRRLLSGRSVWSTSFVASSAEWSSDDNSTSRDSRNHAETERADDGQGRDSEIAARSSTGEGHDRSAVADSHPGESHSLPERGFLNPVILRQSNSFNLNTGFREQEIETSHDAPRLASPPTSLSQKGRGRVEDSETTTPCTPGTSKGSFESASSLSSGTTRSCQSDAPASTESTASFGSESTQTLVSRQDPAPLQPAFTPAPAPSGSGAPTPVSSGTSMPVPAPVGGATSGRHAEEHEGHDDASSYGAHGGSALNPAGVQATPPVGPHMDRVVSNPAVTLTSASNPGVQGPAPAPSQLESHASDSDGQGSGARGSGDPGVSGDMFLGAGGMDSALALHPGISARLEEAINGVFGAMMPITVRVPVVNRSFDDHGLPSVETAESEDVDRAGAQVALSEAASIVPGLAALEAKVEALADLVGIEPKLADLVFGFNPFDGGVLETAIDRFVGQLNEIQEEFVTLDSTPVGIPTVVAVGVALGVAETVRRRLEARRSTDFLRGRGREGFVFPGIPGSLPRWASEDR